MFLILDKVANARYAAIPAKSLYHSSLSPQTQRRIVSRIFRGYPLTQKRGLEIVRTRRRVNWLNQIYLFPASNINKRLRGNGSLI